MNLRPQIIIISFHFHPGLENEIISLAEEVNAVFWGTNRYKNVFSKINTATTKLLFQKASFHVYNTSIINLILLFHKLFFQSKIHYYFHEPTLKLSFKNSLIDNLKCLVVNIIHYIFFVFANDLIVFSDCGFQKIPKKFNYKITSRPLPFNLNEISNFRTSEYFKGKILKILFFGNINSGKNPEDFSNIFSQLNDNRYHLRILLTDPSYFKKLKKYSSQNIEILFFQALSDFEIIEELANCNVVLLPHSRCTQSAILEKATFLGKPILFGTCSCFKEYHNIYGLPFGADVEGVKDTLNKMISNYTFYQSMCYKRHFEQFRNPKLKNQ